MPEKSDKNLERRAAKLLEERKKLRSKITAQKRKTREHTDAMIIKYIRSHVSKGRSTPTEIFDTIARFLNDEADTIKELKEK